MEACVSVEQEILDKTFTFPVGLPGFLQFHRFVFTQTEEERPFAFMRSVDDPSVSFLVIEAFYLKGDYVMDVDDTLLEDIGSPGPLDCLVFFILKVESWKPFVFHANLRAPLIIHKEKRLGRQITLNESSYSTQERFEF
ncbi:MAG: flagellar assembly protein FliW [Verrucomicrobium sp.]|nr:flagellar assembly protein FliW [Verrucomicrobium sp.]